MLNHMYQSHDIWHVVTGWGNDLPGEVGRGGFYAAQFGNPSFFGFMLALIYLNVIMRKANLGPVFEAFNAGYQAGKRTQPLFGALFAIAPALDCLPGIAAGPLILPPLRGSRV